MSIMSRMLSYFKLAYIAYLKKNKPYKLFSIRHRLVTGRSLNIDNPVSLYDKIAYLEFCSDTTQWSRLADKVCLRDYVNECGLSCCPELLGVWERAEDIDFNVLPKSFVIKTNNGSATNILVNNKDDIDAELVCAQLNQWLKYDYGYETCQPHYSRIHPLILAEEFLGDGQSDLPDYKLYCVNGHPLYIHVMTERVPNTHIVKEMILDMNWVPHPEFCWPNFVPPTPINKPTSFDKMVEYAEILARPFPFVRVDFYEVNQEPVLGEMTFTPGFDGFNDKFEFLLGKLVDISSVLASSKEKDSHKL